MADAARLTALIATVLVLAVGSATAAGTGVHATFLPRSALQGQSAQISVAVRPAGTACTLRIRYHDGSFQPGLARVVASDGRASWSWTVPTTVQAGPALAGVRCGRAGSLSRRLVVVGRLVAPTIAVEKTGFSTRPTSGVGTRLSYGILLHNSSDTRDATHVVVQTNFVLADDHLLGTDSQRVDGIAAGSDYAVGNTVTFPGPAPVVRLEVVVQVGAFVAHSMHLPTLDNIHLVPEPFDSGWVGTIEGELQNTDPTLTLRLATLSAVVFDADGNILGGGTGLAGQQLPPGAREFLSLGTGLDVIPFGRAATATVSVSPTWAQLGT